MWSADSPLSGGLLSPLCRAGLSQVCTPVRAGGPKRPSAAGAGERVLTFATRSRRADFDREALSSSLMSVRAESFARRSYLVPSAAY